MAMFMQPNGDGRGDAGAVNFTLSYAAPKSTRAMALVAASTRLAHAPRNVRVSPDV